MAIHEYKANEALNVQLGQAGVDYVTNRTVNSDTFDILPLNLFITCWNIISELSIVFSNSSKLLTNDPKFCKSLNKINWLSNTIVFLPNITLYILYFPLNPLNSWYKRNLVIDGLMYRLNHIDAGSFEHNPLD